LQFDLANNYQRFGIFGKFWKLKVFQKRRQIGKLASRNEGKTGMGRLNPIFKHNFPAIGIIYIFTGE